ncbi:MAG: AP2 domain-containing protein [Acidobacteriota bacterium]|nr:AP2 domain-containing protein [Acidobacteriota bacterium]
MAKSGHKGISRIDCPERKTVGWYVRVRLKNVTNSKFISDRAHGGKEAALEKAIERRDQMEQALGKPRTDWVVVGNNPRNKSGVVGVSRAVKKYTGKDGTIYLNEVYQVSWHAGREKKGQTSVSIKKYGELGAFRRACAIRRQKELEMYGQVVVSKWAESLGKLGAA